MRLLPKTGGDTAAGAGPGRGQDATKPNRPDRNKRLRAAWQNKALGAAGDFERMRKRLREAQENEAGYDRPQRGTTSMSGWGILSKSA